MDFVISSTHDAARRVIAEAQIIRSSAEDSSAFATVLLNPRRPTQKLRAAARRYLRAMGS